MMPAEDPFVPGGTFGRYEIVDRIGEGGMASVWKAMHLGLRKPVAIKTLRADLTASEKARERFLREGEAIARIRHANVVEVHDVGIVADTPYLVMEFLEGEDLRSLFARRGALPLVELADLAVPVCAALAFAHDEGVVHRDIKPGNVFLARTRDRGITPKVLDFGVSRLRDDRTGRVHTGTAVVLGTPRYMAPEQVRGARDVDGRADQYSVGVMLYQGATGRVPIDDAAVFELLRKVVNGDFPTPRSVRPDLPETFERVVLRAMAKLPEQRFASMRDLGAALLPFASERTRVLYSDTLNDAHQGFVEAPPAMPLAPDPNNATVTLGGTPLELPAARHSTTHVRVLSGLLASVAVVAFGLSLWLAARAPTGTPTPVAAPLTVRPLTPATPPPAPVAQPLSAPVAQPPPAPVAQPLAPVVTTLPPPVVEAPAERAVAASPRTGRPRTPRTPPRVTTGRDRVSSTSAPRGVNAHDVD